MTSHTGRLYALAGSLFAFFVLWAAIAAHPFAATTGVGDPRLVALAQRERRLRTDAVRVQAIVDRRLAAHRAALAKRRAEIAAAQLAASRPVTVQAAQTSSPSVRVVTLPPLVITKTS